EGREPRRVRHRPPHSGRLQRESLHGRDRQQQARAEVRAEGNAVTRPAGPAPDVWSRPSERLQILDQVCLLAVTRLFAGREPDGPWALEIRRRLPTFRPMRPAMRTGTVR